jgi:gamma-tubulin complex component 2
MILFANLFVSHADGMGSITDLVGRILPLCSHYVRVCEYVDTRQRYEYGLINHAFCSAVRSLLKEYLILVAQLENQSRQGKLTLQVSNKHGHNESSF